MSSLVSAASAGSQGSFGTESVANVAQGAFAAGWAAGSFGGVRSSFNALANALDFNLVTVQSQVAGNVRLDFTASSRPLTRGGGFAAAAFGAAGVANVAQGAFAASVAPAGFGASRVSDSRLAHDLALSFTLAYTAPPALNTPFYFGGQALVTTAGAFAAGSFGIAAMLGVASFAPAGIADFKAGATTIWPGARNGGALDFNLVIASTAQPGSNVRMDFSAARPLTAVGAMAASAFGAATVANVAQGAFAAAIGPSPAGSTRIAHAAFANELAFDFHDGPIPANALNVPFAFGAGRPLRPGGFTATMWGLPQLDRAVHGQGFDASLFGVPLAVGPRTALPLGALDDTIGAPRVYNSNQYLRPGGYDAAAWGSALLTLRYPQIINLGSEGIAPGRFGFAADGDGFIAYSRRVVQPTGPLWVAFGTTTIGDVDRSLDQAGSGIVAGSFGTQFIAYRERAVYPQFITGFAAGRPSIDETHYVAPSGLAASGFGTQYVHDNRQFPAPAGFDAALYGAADVSRSPRVVAPVGFPSTSEVFPSSRWGNAQVVNQSQIVYALHYPDQEVGEGGVFGSPLYTFVLNRNRTLGVTGIVPGKVSHAVFIDNTGRELLLRGLDASGWGVDTFIAYRVRTVTPTDPIGPEVMAAWGVVTKPPQLFPAGIAPGALGTPSWSNPPQSTRFVGHILDTAYGLPFVAPRVRGVQQYYPYGGLAGTPDVELAKRYLAPPAIEPGGFGNTTLTIHFNIIAPRWPWQHDNVSQNVTVRNKTPQLYTYGKDQAEFGQAEIRWNPYPLAPPGTPAASWGATTIEHREKTLRAAPIGAPGFGPNTQAQNAIANPPSTRTYQASGADSLVMGAPSLSRNQLFVAGWQQVGFGSAQVILMGALVPSIQTGPAIGVPRIIGPQYVRMVGMPAPDDPLSPEPKPLPRLSPFTIYCAFTVPSGYTPVGAWQLMDSALANAGGYVGSSAADRPFFGGATITNARRYLEAVGAADDACGQPQIDLRDRMLLPQGLRPKGVGYPVIPHPETLGVLNPPAAEALGAPAIQLKNRTVRAQGALEFRSDGNSFVSFFDRTLLPVGTDMLTPGAARVHPPEPTIPVGFDSSAFGDAFIDFRIRHLAPPGWEEFVSDYEIDTFDQRMRVSKNNRQYAFADPARLGEVFGQAFVDQSIRVLADAGQIRAGGVPGPDVRFQSIVALGGYGFDSSVFGDVQRWEAGKVKPQGEDYALYGNHGRVNRATQVVGWDSAVLGVPRRGEALDPAGFDLEAWGLPTTTHADGLDFVCGLRPRAIPPQGQDYAAFGAPTVS